MHPLLVQILCYMTLIFLVAGAIGFIQKGFFWKYLKVRLSFGKKIMIKLRAVNRDFFIVGEVTDGYLVFKHKKDKKRIKIRDSSAFYKCMHTSWIDVDEESNNVCQIDYKTVPGFDAIKYNDLYLRALYRPPVQSNKEKLIFMLIIGIGVLCLIGVGLAYIGYKNDAIILQKIIEIGGNQAKAVVTGGGL